MWKNNRRSPENAHCRPDAMVKEGDGGSGMIDIE